MPEYHQYLQANPYPGRGILLGTTPGGTHAVAAYFIMGRSENSRNRVFLPTEDGIRTAPQDPAKLEDPSLIIYHPVRRLGDTLIITNGDQTDTIYSTMQAGGSFCDALLTRTYEPDAPHFTPRISALLPLHGAGGYQLSILHKARGNDDCMRLFFQYMHSVPGTGHLIHTYAGSEDGVLQPFSGAPVEVTLPEGDASACADALWGSLNADNRVALYVHYAPRNGGEGQLALRSRFD